MFDAVDLARTLDIDILASKNTVTEIIASADVGPGAGLLNLGAGVGYRATADLGSSDSMSLTQKTAGALTVTQDVDQLPAEAVGELQFSSMAVKATNATALTAVFDNQSVDPVHASIFLMGDKASSLAIVSGGGASDGTYENYINYSVGLGAATAGPDGLLKSITVTGDQHLILAISANATESNLATIDATAFKSVLYTGLDALKDGGTIALGADTTGVIRVNGVTSNAAGMESISGFGKAAAAAFDVAPSQAAIDAADTLNLKAASGLMADTVTPDAANLNVSVSKGVATFGGTGPSTLMEALTAIDAHDAAGSGDTVVLQYIGDTYVFVEGGTVGLADDVVIKLTGLTGVSKAAFATNGLIVG